jgi:hypothetical protein
LTLQTCAQAQERRHWSAAALALNMSSRWHTFKERFHQKALPLGADKLKPTSNERCSHMLAQARTFLQQMRKCEQAVRRMAAVNADSVTVIRTAMTAPLPCKIAWGGRAGEIAGQGFQGQRMAAAVADASHKTEAEVLAPLTRWQDVLTRLSVSCHSAEAAHGGTTSCLQGAPYPPCSAQAAG